MITFSSRATGDLTMLDAHATQLLAAMGRDDPTRGAIMPKQIDEAVARLEAAITRAPSAKQTAAAMSADDHDVDADQSEPVTLAQRAYPLLDMLRRARLADAPVMWGV